jgi:hypothetical protein
MGRGILVEQYMTKWPVDEPGRRNPRDYGDLAQTRRAWVGRQQRCECIGATFGPSPNNPPTTEFEFYTDHQRPTPSHRAGDPQFPLD